MSVTDSRGQPDHIRRRRRCDVCGHRWATLEVAAERLAHEYMRSMRMLEQLAPSDRAFVLSLASRLGHSIGGIVMSEISLAEQIRGAEREIGFRMRSYPHFVNKGKMSQAEADRQIAVMRAILETLTQLSRQAAPPPAEALEVEART